jgi:hypothetical protein
MIISFLAFPRENRLALFAFALHLLHHPKRLNEIISSTDSQLSAKKKILIITFS